MSKKKRKRIYAYKVFHPDWTCIGGFQYELGKTYKMFGELDVCRSGFHFCMKLVDCFSYYQFDPCNKVAVVEVLGKIARERDNDGAEKCCTDKIRIVRELKWSEVLELVNLGDGNTGFGNAGHLNDGDRNVGNYNQGSGNIGDYNHGDENTGDNNDGKGNSGCYNYGDSNYGDYNIGDENIGDGNYGSFNNGFGNDGDDNIGDGNTGKRNIGDWNVGDGHIGVFNTAPVTIMMFNKPTDWTLEDWEDSEACNIMSDAPVYLTEWVESGFMSDEELMLHPSYSVIDGYLKVDHEVVRLERQQWWDELEPDQRAEIYDLPNFDVEIFEQCTGIKVSDYVKVER